MQLQILEFAVLYFASESSFINSVNIIITITSILLFSLSILVSFIHAKQ